MGCRPRVRRVAFEAIPRRGWSPRLTLRGGTASVLGAGPEAPRIRPPPHAVIITTHVLPPLLQYTPFKRHPILNSGKAIQKRGVTERSGPWE